MRVCKPGGRIGLACWTPDSVVGQLLALIAVYVPLPAGVRSPALWGTEERLGQLFSEAAERIRVQRREFVFRYRSPMHWIEVFRTYYGPLTRTFGALEPGRPLALTRDVLDMLEEDNQSRDRSLVLPSEYLEVAIDVRGATKTSPGSATCSDRSEVGA